jgi:hypothetical protein
MFRKVAIELLAKWALALSCDRARILYTHRLEFEKKKEWCENLCNVSF